MTAKDYKIARELQSKLNKIVSLVDFRVFGSRARGDAQKNSDMDVFIEVAKLNKGVKKQIRHIVWEVSFEHLLLISSLIFSKKEIDNSPLRSSPIVRNILEEGVKI